MSGSINKMSIDEIKNAILSHCYKRFFEEKSDDYFDAKAFADLNHYSQDEVFKVIEEFREAGWINTECAGGSYEFTPDALIYCENNKLVSESLIVKQHSIRIKLLNVLSDLQDQSLHGELAHWEEWLRKSEVDDDDFNRNIKVIEHQCLVTHDGEYSYKLTLTGKSVVADFRKRDKRLKDFERLERLEVVTKQERGHKLEDLLADSAEWEGWEVTRRPRSQGTENDIIMHVGLHYFLSSCKWESKRLSSDVAELLETRVRRRPPANGGILFSMSGFAAGCINEMRQLIASALIIPFGPKDIRLIMQNKNQ